MPRKGYDVLIEALKETRRPAVAIDDCRRSNPQRRRRRLALIHQCQLAGLTENVSLTGALSDDELADEYAHADVFVTASHFEGYGMAVTTRDRFRPCPWSHTGRVER